MEETKRFTGIGRLNTIFDDIACWRMKLLGKHQHSLKRKDMCMRT